jgi:glycosyltransferase involved in cell wall biosynthesis
VSASERCGALKYNGHALSIIRTSALSCPPMPKISAIIHTHNDAVRIGRTLETLRPCDQVIVVDHDSQDETRKVARKYGASVKKAIVGVDDGAYVFDADHDWVLLLLPSESLSEALEAALYEWKQTEPGATIGYTIGVRQEAPSGWSQQKREMRLVNRTCVNWPGPLPRSADNASELGGDILRFTDASPQVTPKK